MTTKLRWLVAGLLAFAACSHDSVRDNPLDPELSPPVELQVAVDDTSGTAALTWSPYEGEAGFLAYWVLRTKVGEDSVDTLAVVDEVTRNSFVDSTLDFQSVYSYWVSVINAAGFESPSSPQTTPPLNLLPIELTRVDFDSRSASASLRWTRYKGPDFVSYRITRRTDNTDPQTVALIENVTSTAFVDSGLSGNRSYTYQVIVTAGVETELSSNEESGLFHALVDSWPLDLDAKGAVRLEYRNGQIVAAVADLTTIRLLSFETTGQLAEEQQLISAPRIEARSISLALTPGGPHYLSFSQLADDSQNEYLGRPTTVVAFDTEGLVNLRELTLFERDLSDLVPADSQAEIFLIGFRISFDEVFVLSPEGDVLMEESFENGLPDWDLLRQTFGVEDGVATISEASNYFWQADGPFRRRDGRTAEGLSLLLPLAAGTLVGSWNELRVESGVTVADYFGGLRIDLRQGDAYLQLAIALHMDSQADHDRGGLDVASFGWNSNTAGEGMEIIDFWVSPDITYRQALEISQGHARASVVSPIVWTGTTSTWTSLATVGEFVAFTHGAQPYVLREEGGALTANSETEGPVVDASTWNFDGNDATLAVCVPAVHQVFVNKARTSANGVQLWLRWLGSAVTRLGSGVGEDPGELLFPMAVEAGPDGRIFVVDAGNSRIQVFDAEFNHLTQWGGSGAGPGELNFGSGGTPEDYGGSIAVDDEGFIYVADVGNGRIQKFAP